MPTKLVLQAYHINQLIAQVICPFHYVSWDYHKLKWKYEDICFRRMGLYYFGVALMIFYILIFIATIPFLGNIHRKVTVAGLVVLVMLLFLLVEYLFISNGREWVYVTNWMFHHERIPLANHEFYLSNRLSVRHILHIWAMILAGMLLTYLIDY